MTSGPEVQENLTQARTHLESAARQGAALAALPENFAFMGLGDADKRAVAEADGDGPIQQFLARTARELKVWIIGGTIPLRSDAVKAGRAAVSTAPSAGRVAAASLVYTSDGVRAARYDKIHLFDVDIPGKAETYRESAHVAPGSRTAVVDTPVGRVGLSVCYDMRFPELFRDLSKAGAELLSIPSAFTAPTGRGHRESVLRHCSGTVGIPRQWT
jgi:nitrilase